ETPPLAGGPCGADEILYRRLGVDLGIQAPAPVVEGFIRPSKSPGHTLRVLGLDLLAERNLRPGLGNGSVDVRTLLTMPGSVLLAAPTAAELGIGVRQSFPVLINGVEQNLTLAALFETSRPGAFQALHHFP